MKTRPGAAPAESRAMAGTAAAKTETYTTPALTLNPTQPPRKTTIM